MPLIDRSFWRDVVPAAIAFTKFNPEVKRQLCQAWISRNKLKSKLRLKSEILLKFEKSQKNAFLEKNLAQILTQLEKKLNLPPHQT